MSWDPVTEREIEADAALTGAQQEEDLERPDIWTAPIPDPSEIVQEGERAER